MENIVFSDSISFHCRRETESNNIYLICNLLFSLKLRISEICCFSTGDTFKSSLLHGTSLSVRGKERKEAERSFNINVNHGVYDKGLGEIKTQHDKCG